MINKLLALSAIFAAYLILMMPVAYAQAVSSISYESEKQPDEVLGNLMIAIPTFLADIVDVIKTVIENFMDSVIPGAKAQACDGDGTCGGSEYAQDCCFDCGCYAGHYCDWDGVSDKADISCRLYTDINLVSASIYPTIFENCNEAHETNITLIINDPPSSMIFTGKKLLLNSGSQKVPIGDCGLQSESIPGQSIYKCAVTIPVLPSCGTGQNTITHNSVQLNLSFKNGATNDRYDLVKSAPDISINSFTCGNGIPETSIGEDSTNCCFDAGCFSNWFCDITESDATSNPSAGTCRSKLSINDVSVSTPATTSFKTHDTSTGTDISFDLRVSNVNGLKSIQTPTCNIAETACSLQCGTPFQSDGVFKSSCLMNFKISDYDLTEEYNFVPSLTLSLVYNNGSSTSTTEITTANTFQVSVSSSVCGNNVKDYNEYTQNCCYDAPCPEGYYCDWTDGSEGTNRCKDESLIAVTFEDISSDILSTTTKAGHGIDQGGFTSTPILTEKLSTTIGLKITNVPDTIDMSSLSSSCSFGTDDIGCTLTPYTSSYDGNLHLTYKMEIGEIEYKLSDYFDSSTNKITLNTNTFTFTFSYTNSSFTNTKEVELSFDPITINVLPGCGNGLVETELGEDYNTCCVEEGIECGAGNECIGTAENNLCIDPTDIVPLFTIPKQDCEIRRSGEECISDTIDIRVDVYNAPSDIDITNAYFMLDDETKDLVSCDEPGSLQGSVRSYTCHLKIDYPVSYSTKSQLNCIEYQIIGTTREICTASVPNQKVVVPHIIDLNLDISYDRDNTRSIHSTSTFDVTQSMSDHLVTCEKRVQQFDNMAVDMDKVRRKLATLGIILGAIAISLGIGCIACTYWCPSVAPYLCVGSLVTGILSCIYNAVSKPESTYGEQITNIEQARNEFTSVCADSGVSSSLTLDDKIDRILSKYNKADEMSNTDKWADVTSKLGCVIGIGAALVFGPKAMAGAKSASSMPDPATTPTGGEWQNPNYNPGTSSGGSGSPLGDYNTPGGTFA